MRRLLVVSFVFALVALTPAHADPVGYVPPVDSVIVDPFRPPADPWGPGNRGIDYAPAPGTPVHAAAAGVVTFAGQVGGSLHVVVRHADGIRTSYSFLATIAVAAGDRVEQGQLELGWTIWAPVMIEWWKQHFLAPLAAQRSATASGRVAA